MTETEINNKPEISPAIDPTAQIPTREQGSEPNAPVVAASSSEIAWWLDPDPRRALEKYRRMYRKSAYAMYNFRAVQRMIPRPNVEGATALDYGCGGGQITVLLAQLGYQVTATDTAPCSLAACRLHLEDERVTERVHLRLAHASTYWQGLDGPFDLIVAKDVIEHIQDDVGFLREAASRLRPGGQLLLVTQNDYSWNYYLEAPRSLAKDPYWMGWHASEHVRFYNKPRLKGLLRAFGLKPLRWHGHYLVPYRAFNGWFLCKVRNAIDKLAGEKVFYWPDRLLGHLWPFTGLGWSIHVLAVKETELNNPNVS